MMRHIKSPVLLIILAFTPLLGCSKDDPKTATAPAPTKPDCTYQLPEKTTSLTQTKNMDLLGAPFDQEKLSNLMSLSEDQDTCFIRYQGHIEVYKISDTFSAMSVGEDNPVSPRFDALTAAPEDLVVPWKDLENRFNMPLMGMTSISFFDNPDHREIVDTRIIVNTQARPWHLWHEFGHVLIAQTRLGHADQHLANPTDAEVDGAKKELLALLEEGSAEQQLEAFKKLTDVYHRYDARIFLEEIAIEVTLLHYANEMKSDLVAPQDPSESFSTVDFFYRTHVNWYKDFFRQFRPLLRDNKTLAPALREMEKNLKESDSQLRQSILDLKKLF
jgi:hypothetical protein